MLSLMLSVSGIVSFRMYIQHSEHCAEIWQLWLYLPIQVHAFVIFLQYYKFLLKHASIFIKNIIHSQNKLKIIYTTFKYNAKLYNYLVLKQFMNDWGLIHLLLFFNSSCFELQNRPFCRPKSPKLLCKMGDFGF